MELAVWANDAMAEIATVEINASNFFPYIAKDLAPVSEAEST